MKSDSSPPESINTYIAQFSPEIQTPPPTTPPLPSISATAAAFQSPTNPDPPSPAI